MFCPYCLEEMERGNRHGVNSCPKSGDAIPPLYLEYFKRGKCLVVSTIGFQSHGKTAYLGALYLELLGNPLAEAWQDFSVIPLDDFSLSTIYGLMRKLKKGEVPDGNPINFPKPAIMRLTDSPFSPDMMLLFYDVAGEVLQSAARINQYAHFVRKSEFILALFSLENVQQEAEFKELLTNYVMAVGEAERREQHLVVVFTKGDKESFQNLLRLHDISLVDYLNDAKLREVSDPYAYVAQLRKISRHLQRAFRDDLGFRAADSLARRYFRSVSYTVVSALGSEPVTVNGRPRIPAIRPRRVLDPLLLGLDRLDSRFIRRLGRFFQ